MTIRFSDSKAFPAMPRWESIEQRAVDEYEPDMEKPGIEGVWALDPVMGWDPERPRPPQRPRIKWWVWLFWIGLAATLITLAIVRPGIDGLGW